MGKYTGKKSYGNEQLQELGKKGNEEQGVYVAVDFRGRSRVWRELLRDIVVLFSS